MVSTQSIQEETSVSIASTEESPDERPNTSCASAYETEVEISMVSMHEGDDAEVSLCIDEKQLQHQKRETLSTTVAQITEGRYSPIASTLNTSWDDVSIT